MNTPTWSSPIDLPDSVRLNMIPLLNQHLADAIDLGLQAKQAHWNVKGPQFVSLHGLFDEVAEILEELTDELAERVVELGGIAAAPRVPPVQGVAAPPSRPAITADSGIADAVFRRPAGGRGLRKPRLLPRRG